MTISRVKSGIRLGAVLAVLVGMVTQSFAQNACMLRQSFNDPHPVIHDDRSLFWVRPLQVDADGSPNAYHRDDPHGKRGLAIEYIGNGMTIYRDGTPMTFELDERDNSEWLKVYRKIVANGWKAPPGYSVDIYGFARDPSGAVCVTDGRLVSSTSLQPNPNLHPCNQRKYMDARRFPGFVVPNRASDEKSVENADPEVATPFAEQGLARGDLGIVYNPASGLWKGALLYDTGPRHLLGEGSLRLVMNLRGMREVPRTALKLNALGIVETFSVTFPRSVADLGPSSTWTPEKVEEAAANRFKAWGGGTFTGALQRMFACAQQYKAEQTEVSSH